VGARGVRARVARAFALALLARTRAAAALFGLLALALLLAGYVAGVEVRGDAASHALILFWGAAAIVAGPLLGLGAYWVRHDRDSLAALGSGAVSGVLVGEGVYGVTEISDTTYVPYWWCEIAVGILLLGVLAWLRLRRPPAVAMALGVALVTVVGFGLVYRANLIGVLP
jgi:Family of unknown function (DUF6518)